MVHDVPTARSQVLSAVDAAARCSNRARQRHAAAATDDLRHGTIVTSR
jgi:hypothetical protein